MALVNRHPADELADVRSEIKRLQGSHWPRNSRSGRGRKPLVPFSRRK